MDCLNNATILYALLVGIFIHLIINLEQPLCLLCRNLEHNHRIGPTCLKEKNGVRGDSVGWRLVPTMFNVHVEKWEWVVTDGTWLQATRPTPPYLILSIRANR